jgi:hypothetical protein
MLGNNCENQYKAREWRGRRGSILNMEVRWEVNMSRDLHEVKGWAVQILWNREILRWRRRESQVGAASGERQR